MIQFFRKLIKNGICILHGTLALELRLPAVTSKSCLSNKLRLGLKNIIEKLTRYVNRIDPAGAALILAGWKSESD